MLVRGRNDRLVRPGAAAVHGGPGPAGRQLLPALQLGAARRPLYESLVADGTLPGGIACDDGTAAHFADDALAGIVADRPDAFGYRVEPDGAGGATGTRLLARLLG